MKNSTSRLPTALSLHTSTSTSKRHNQQHSSNAAIIIGFVITISWFAQGGASELQNKIIKSRKRTPTALRHNHHLSTTINKHFQRSNNIICSIEIESDGLGDSISPGHFAPHGIRRGAATYVATASPPSLASIALQGRWSDYHSTHCRPSQQYTSNAAIIIEANPSVPRSTPALVTTLPYQRWQRQGHLPSRLQPNQRKQ